MPCPVQSSSSEPSMATMHATLAWTTAAGPRVAHSSIESITLQVHEQNTSISMTSFLRHFTKYKRLLRGVLTVSWEPCRSEATLFRPPSKSGRQNPPSYSDSQEATTNASVILSARQLAVGLLSVRSNTSYVDCGWYYPSKRHCPVVVALEGSALWGNTLAIALLFTTWTGQYLLDWYYSLR